MINIEKIRESPVAIIFLGSHPGIIQSILDFDFLCEKSESSAKVIIAGGKSFERYFFGKKEILIPVYPSLDEVSLHIKKDITYFFNVTSGRRVLASSQEAIKHLPHLIGGVVFAELQDKPIPGSHTASELDELKSLSKAVDRRFGERVRVRHILIHVAPTAPKAERDAALDKVKGIQKRLKRGEDFSDLARKNSDDPGSKEHGGELPPFSRGEMVPPFEKAAYALNVGETSDVVTTDFGYHILQVMEKKAASKPSFDDVKDDLRDYLFQQRGAKRFEQYVKDLRAKADIKVNKID